MNITPLPTYLTKKRTNSVPNKNSKLLLIFDDQIISTETREILADGKLMDDIKEAREDVKEGRVQDWEEVKKELGWEDV